MSLRLGPTFRITLGLLSLAVTLLLVLDLLFGVFPDPQAGTLQSRRQSAEALGVQVAALLMHGNREALDAALPEIVRRDPALRSAGVRSASGEWLAATTGHRAHWAQLAQDSLGRENFVVPINAEGGQPWGEVQISYAPLAQGWSTLLSPALRLMLVFAVLGAGCYYLYLRRSLLHLDPSAAIPERVQTAFDAMAEAIVVLDAQQRIVMVNAAFERLLPEGGEAPLSHTLEALAWLRPGREHISGDTPWTEAMRTRRASEPCAYEATLPAQAPRSLIATASPVLDARNGVRGCMVSFNDVTELEEANRQLVLLMADLSSSKEQLEVQNRELQRLAAVDPMTGARNRRSFFPEFERMFAEARAQQLPMAFIMADIDKFKAVNDNYGHAIGDKVIQKFAAILLAAARDTDIVCRYGGEEFCIALPATDAGQALQVAERIRERVAAEVGPALPLEAQPLITASFGVASLAEAAESASALADQADQALYHSKHTGRNRCTAFSPALAGAPTENA